MKIKKFFKKKFKKIPFKEERGAIVFTLAVAAVALIGSLLTAGALAGARGLNWIVNPIFAAFMGIIRAVVGGFLAFSSQFLETVMNEDFVKIVKNISGDANVKKAWGMIRDFANMFIALGFVICGIGTALRIQEYEAKKTLVPLILVALLVNFTYFLLFNIFDISNSIMNFFLGESKITFGPAMRVGKIWQGMAGMKTMDFMMKGAMIITMELLWATTYFTYALLFLLRYVAIPILIIFSPIAFVSLVFKFSQPIWEKWLNQFIGWCLVGIFAGMAIYLSNILMTSEMIWKMESALKLATATPAQRLLLEPFVYILPLGALLFGLFLSGASALVGVSAISGGMMAMGTTVMAAGVGGMQKISGALGAKAPGGAGAAGGGAPGAGAGAGGAAAGGGFPGTEAMTGGAAMGLAEKAGEAFKRSRKVGRPTIGSGVPPGVRAKAAGRATMAVGKGLGLGAAAIATKSLPAAPGIAADVVKSVGGQLKGVTGEVSGIGK